MVSLVKIVIFCTSWIQANGFICIISFNLHKRHRRDCYPPHFTDGKTEAHRGYEKICPRPYHYKVSVWFSIVNALKLPLDSSCAEKNPFSPSPSLFASSPEDGISHTPPLPPLASALSSFSRSCHKRCFLSSYAVLYSTNNLAFLKGTLFPLAFPQLWREENRNCKNIDKFSDCRLLILRIPSSQDGLAMLTGTMPGFPSSQLQAPTCCAASCLPALAEVFLKLIVHDDLTCWGCLCFSFSYIKISPIFLWKLSLLAIRPGGLEMAYPTPGSQDSQVTPGGPMGGPYSLCP